jgi:pSer/pThr/pTyr-binding forkhead associated (FHA) protein
MWIAETLDSEGNIILQVLLKGPTCRVGRHADNCLSFPHDKSISRSHADLSIINKKLILRDLGSKFGTFLGANNDLKVDSTKDPLELASGQVVRFGAVHSRVRFVRVTMSLCLTRLDKKEKEKVKAAASISGSKIVNAAEDATHIITNSISGATLKIITGLVLKKSIVTTDWLSFLFTEKPSELIPSPDL